jgi:formate dehydrogenase iron-sulfur subunit
LAIREKELSGLSTGGDPPRRPGFLDRIIAPFRRGVPPEPRPVTGFYTDTTVCIGCKACEVACKQWNQLPADGFHWTGNSYDNTGELSATSWRHVKFIEQFPANGTTGEPGKKLPLDVLPQESASAPQGGNPDFSGRWLMMSDVCKHCVTAPCQQACPTGSLLHNEFDNVYIQPDICNGCAYCIAACPFGVITRSTLDGHAHKCTLCYDRQRDGLVPACAKACPTQSIQFGPLEELRGRARKRMEDLRRSGVASAYLYGDVATSSYSELNSFYLLVDRPSTYGLPEEPFNPWLHMGGDYLRAAGSGLTALLVLLLTFLAMGR